MFPYHHTYYFGGRNCLCTDEYKRKLSGTAHFSPANSDGSGYNEPDTAAGYKRAFLGNYQSSNNIMTVKTDLGGELVATNDNIIYFPEATSNWAAVVGWGLFGSASGGTPLFYGNLSTAVTVQQNYVPMFRKENFVMKIDPVVT